MDLLSAARRVLGQSPLCDSCLGRPFADRSHGLTVAARGRALRVVVALTDDEPFEVPDPEACWVCEGLCARYDAWAERAADALKEYALETYQVGSRLPPLLEENERLLRESADLPPDAGEPLKAEVNREVGKRVGEILGLEVDFERPDAVVLLDVDADLVEPRLHPAFVFGRYRKLERGLPQTEWPCRECGGTGRRGDGVCKHCDGTGHLYAESVEQLVAPHVRDAMSGTDATFHGAGREDVDARMLGTGRPFVVEVAHPTDRFPDIAALEAAINEAAEGRVEVEGLRLASYEMVERVKELPAHKTYRVRVRFDQPVDEDAFREALKALDGATIEQRTPERVRHRRAEKVRTRTVRDIDGELENGDRATVDIVGEGGLYVKELVHGDGGRTEPSLAALLGVEVEVTALDVVEVEADEGAFEDPAYLREPPDDRK